VQHHTNVDHSIRDDTQPIITCQYDRQSICCARCYPSHFYLPHLTKYCDSSPALSCLSIQMPFHNYASALILLCKFMLCSDLETVMSMYNIRACRGVDPYGTGGTCSPNIYERGTYMVMSHQYLEVISFRMWTRVSTRNYVQIPKECG